MTVEIGAMTGVVLLGIVAALGTAAWRLWRSVQAVQARLRADLLTLQQDSQRIQQALSAELEETTATLQATVLEKAALETQRTALTQQCARLRAASEQTSQQVRADSQKRTFEQIQTLLTQYPTLRRMAAAKPELPARNLTATLTVLDNLIDSWGVEPIGAPWEAVAYDPQLHQGDVADLQVGESVYVRFVGYRQGAAAAQRILVPAKVSRTLPGGMAG